ncbi:MAG: NAD(P)-dependent oxidoreductase [Acidilobaceae archaeon]
MRVLVTETVSEKLLKILADAGLHVDYRPGISRDELIRVVGEYDVIVVRGRTRVDSEVLEAGAGRLKIVARAGIGLDNIDVEKAEKLGVVVVNAGDASIESVAELTIALTLIALRRLDYAMGLVKSGKWERPLGRELSGKRLLVIGFGRIGRRVAELAKSFGALVTAYDVVDVRSEAEKRGVEVAPDLCSALREADIVSLHVPLSESTRKLVNKDLLERCFKRGSILVNTSRGAVVDAEAVLWALDHGILSAYAADVLEEEPPVSELQKRLVTHPRVIVTPHVGAQTLEAQERIAEVIGEAIVRLVRRLERNA